MMPVLSLITYPDMLNTEGCLLNSQLPRSAIKMINKEQLYQQFCSFSRSWILSPWQTLYWCTRGHHKDIYSRRINIHKVCPVWVIKMKSGYDTWGNDIMRLQNRVNYNSESQSKQTKFTSLRLTIHMSKLLINTVIKIYMFEIK